MTVLSSHSCASVTGLRPAGASGRGPNPRTARSGVLLMVLAVTLSALGVGCSDGTETTSDAEVEPSGFGKEVTLPISAAVATLVTPGEEPHAQLRPAVRPGTSQQVTLRTDHHVEQQINDQAVRDFSPPSVTIPLTADAKADGVDLVLGTATSPDPALDQQLLAADGSHAGIEFTDLGAVTALRMAPAPSTPDPARAAIEQAFYQAVYEAIAFPADAVGEGAVWTVHQRVSGVVPLDQMTTATLTKRDGNLLTIALDITQTPKSATWQLPNNSGDLDIIDYLMHGAGTITVDLGLPLPVSGAITIGGNQCYRDPHTDVLLRQDVRTQVQWGE
ncbi:hypothetical protein J2W56_005288 [Nocardia kruczakiae]|uniref:Uncharacterized protein n=1 Tax=Nocardia kruczakiae TaxID=261477 RepID=A0ABU1XLU2_9NOCA|nr:hypothetical protein [Nocardia kruczakiae]MDR7171528.1 hypothetical protein [Nocardia kruczakiae]